MFSFVIRTKNEEKYFTEVLLSIFGQKTSEKIEVIVVDSGSSDNTLNIAEKFHCKIIKIPPESFTWGYALNIGISNAAGDIIGIVSGHCILSDEFFIKNSISILNEDENIMAVYGQQKPLQKMDPFEEVDLFCNYPQKSLVKFDKNVDKTIGVSNACCVLKYKAWKMQKYDDKVQSCEDGIWSEQMMKKGCILAYSSRFGVFHSHKLDVQYLYKKYFWREYCPKGNKEKTHNIIFNFFKFYIKKMPMEYKFYCRGFKKTGILCGRSKLLFFVFVKNTAMLHAAIMLNNEQNTKIKYEDIYIPDYIHKLQEKLTTVFWQYRY